VVTSENVTLEVLKGSLDSVTLTLSGRDRSVGEKVTLKGGRKSNV